MKKILVVGWVIAALVLWADETAPTESPIVGGSSCDFGVYNVTGAVGVTHILIPVRFKALAEGEEGEDSLTVADLMSFSSLSDGDVLIRFNGERYNGWTYDIENTRWDADKEIDVPTGVVSDGEEAGNTSLVTGEALWLFRASTTNQVIITLFGKYIEPVGLTSTIKRSPTNVAYNLIANPTGRFIRFEDLTHELLESVDPQNGDQIKFFNSTNNIITYKYLSGLWKNPPKSTALAEIDPAWGFWYIAVAGGTEEATEQFTWPEPTQELTND